MTAERTVTTMGRQERNDLIKLAQRVREWAPPAAAVIASIPRRELVTLLAYLETGSHKAAAHRLGISESTSRQRVSQLMSRIGARNVAEAVWMLRHELEVEAGSVTRPPSP